MARSIFIADPFDDQECLACNVFPICGGGCPIDRQKKKEGIKIDHCSAYKTMLADMLPIYYKCLES
ncbi:MAG: SPASM domain-containing protein [Tannerellaceae bacterium]|nr:SPASM domain-containing protein [Tannerellaceae bacterium]